MADPIVTTVANLRLLTTVSSDVVYETTDYGGGFWYYDSTAPSGTNDNTGTIIKTASNAILRRIFSGFYDVRWFGAKGDAVVNSATGALTSGTDDTDAFQNAVNSINKARGGTLFLPQPKSAYAITKLALLAGVSIYGENGKTPVIALNSSSPGLLYLGSSPVQYITIKGIYLIGNVANTSQHGMYIFATGDYDPDNHTGGLWYSNFEDVEIRGFSGHQWHFEAIDDSDPYAGNDIANQFLTFKNCRGFASASSTSRAIYAIGQFGQCQFLQCEFDGAGSSVANSISVELISSPGVNGTDMVYDVQFIGCTVQSTNLGFKFYYAKAVLNNQHFEKINQAVWADATSNIVINGGTEMYSSTGSSSWAVKSSKASNVIVSGCTLNGSNFIADNGFLTLADNNLTPATAAITTSGITKQSGISSGVLNSGMARHILLNSTNADLKNITSQLGTADDLIVRAWDNGAVDSYTRIYDDGTGNIVLPVYDFNASGVRTLILRQNDVAVFSRNDLAGGNWVLKSINIADRKRNVVPTTGYWTVGEKIYNTQVNAATKIIGWVCTTEGYLTTNTWLANHAYSLGNLVLSNGNIYKVTTAGTSGTTAPSGTTTFTDGTVVWTYFPTAVFTAFGNSYTISETDAKYALLSTTAKAATYTASGNGTTTVITIPHVLSGITTNSTVLITPRNAASAGYSYADIDTSSVYIYYATAPASGTNNLKFSVEIKP
ncbi:MAG: hypothetical protein JWR38_200 [Mucilaginibacter sp.]|nr:hypothetical protein [Mucilaginibacter sp.]